jgi:hypothetical protein
MTPPGFITILGLPLYIILGILTFISLITTLVVGILIMKGKANIPFRYHMYLAGLTLILAILHGIAVAMVFF